MHQVRKTQANVPPQQELQTEHEVPQALQGVHLQYLPVLQQPHPIPCQTPEQEVKELKTPTIEEIPTQKQKQDTKPNLSQVAPKPMPRLPIY